MVRKIADFLFSKENLILFLIFLVFQFFRTQTFNLMYFLFDQVFLNGIISDTYVYNYQGKLLGCEQLLIVNESIANYNWFQRYGMYYAIFLPSLIAFGLFIKTQWKSKTTYWILIAISCFCVLSSLVHIQIAIRVTPAFSEKYIRIIASSLLFIFLGIYIFLFKMSSKQRLQIILIGLPAYFLGTFIWYQMLGPTILPIVV